MRKSERMYRKIEILKENYNKFAIYGQQHVGKLFKWSVSIILIHGNTQLSQKLTQKLNEKTTKWPSTGADDRLSGAPSLPHFDFGEIKHNRMWWKLHQIQGFHSEAARLALFPGESQGVKAICQTIKCLVKHNHPSGDW